jgi:hypothetical protein
MPLASVKEKGEASGPAGGRTVLAKHDFSTFQVVVVVDDEEEEVGGKDPAHGVPVSVDCSPRDVVMKLSDVVMKLSDMVMKLADVYGSVEMERLSIEKEKMTMENLGEIDDDDN